MAVRGRWRTSILLAMLTNERMWQADLSVQIIVAGKGPGEMPWMPYALRELSCAEPAGPWQLSRMYLSDGTPCFLYDVYIA